MKEISEKAKENNAKLRLNVDEQQIEKIFKVKSYIDDLDKV